jgi:hypothetical protein
VQFPSNLAIDGVVVAKSQVVTLKVINECDRTIYNKEQFSDLLATSSNKDILQFLETKNLLANEKGFSFNQILWMLQDKSFYLECVLILRNRKIYSDEVWQYAYHHKDVQSIKEHLSFN